MTTPEQKQNFANWYSYYRTRNLAARAGISRAFVKFGSNIRVGWGKINKSTKISIDGKSVSTIEQGVRPFTDARKKEFLTWLYTVVPSGNTPLRRALDDAGQYYDRPSNAIGPWADNPANGTGTGAAGCRKSFSILMTDGYWNDAMASMATGNHDGQAAATSFTPPKKPDGSAPDLSREPFRDSYSNTLADVAWYYWAKDLLPDHSNNKVVGTTRDPAWWQHMTTYTIGLGVAASIANKDAAFLAADTRTKPGFTWPNGASYQIDDLLHAGVNGHGDFFSAADPDEFVRDMQSIIDAISDIVASSGKIASNAEIPGAQGTSEALLFKMTYKTENWSGELSASELNAISGENLSGAGNVVWKASDAMQPASERKIFTRSNETSGVGSTGIEFEWSSLNAQQKLDLQEGDSVAHGRDVLDYLRGSSARENANGGAFRNRYRADATRSPLGDSPNNGMVYDKATATLYLGANDGMLHAFDAATGAERFAYIPSALFPRLSRLADIDYNHEYYVDGEVVIAEAANQRYLTGALGRGGKGLYGLRVTQPAAFSKDDVLWELNGRASSAQCGSGNNAGILDDLGIVIGKPVVARLASGHTVAIVGNGYNSCQGKASLYIIDVTNGEVLHKVDTPAAGDNGLSTPFAFDHDGDGILTSADVIYAGDLKGNLWRFAEAGGIWKVSFGGAAQAMFTAKNAANQTQPITAQPLAVHHPDTGATYVIFGTGQYLQNADKSNLSIQSLYGLIDGNALPTSTRANLRQRSISFPGDKGTLSDGTNVGLVLVEQAKAGDMDGKRGWFIDFNLTAEPGARIVSASRTVAGGANGMVLEVPVIVPTSDPCERGGGGWYQIIDPFTGAELSSPFFDINADGKVDGNDKTSKGRVPAGFRPDASFGMPGELPADGTYGIYGGSSGNTARTAVDDGSKGKDCKKEGAECIKGRISWREIIRK
jgi:type IV pilus assembly protein PilY1